MAPHNYAKRVERLQELYAAKLNKPVAIRFLPFDAAHTTAPRGPNVYPLEYHDDGYPRLPAFLDRTPKPELLAEAA